MNLPTKRAKIFFTLAANNPDEHLKKMEELTNILINDEILEKIKNVKNVIYKDQQDQRVIKGFKVKEEFRGLQL